MRTESMKKYSWNAEGVLAVLRDLQQNQVWRHYFSDFEFQYGFHGSHEYGQWLRESGLEPERVELIPKNMEHDGEGSG